MLELPEKSQYKLNEVCQYTDTQPYVLRFWESEFPQLSPERTQGGQPVYSRGDVETVLRIKELLEEGEQSISDVRELLENGPRTNSATTAAKAAKVAKAAKAKAKGRGRASETTARKSAVSRRKTPRPRLEPEPAPQAVESHDAESSDGISRERYENAIDEIAHMRLALNDAEGRQRRAEQALQQAEETNERLRDRSARALALVDEVIDGLS
jgi:DNA-binding transcriptional MerR regulator